jgi:predicted CoA-substrate-specific enzyme activase
MTITAGCDVGSLTAKAVVMQHNRILGSSLITSRTNPGTSGEMALTAALTAAGVQRADLACCVGTGYGRDRLDFVDDTRSEIACHGLGAQWLLPSARTVIDIGGQDCKAMHVDGQARVLKFVTNDKCASGTGRFLDVMARVLDVDISDLGRFSNISRSPLQFASTCTVWAQADVIKYLNSGYAVEDIGAGVNAAMANRIAILVNSVGVHGDVVMTGGVAKNMGVSSNLGKLLNARIKTVRKADPQIAGAIGAALYARTLRHERQSP